MVTRQLPPRPRPARRAPGFTLIELMAVLAIMVVLASAAAPSVSGLVASQRARAAGTDLYAALTLARSEAIKRNAEVTLLPVSASNWAAGWRIPNPADSGHPIAVHEAVANAVVSGPAAVVYLANGRVKGDTPPAFDIAIAPAHRCVQVDLGGRPLTQAQACPAS